MFFQLACDCVSFNLFILPYNPQEVFVDDPDLTVVDVDFSDKYLALIVREGRNFQLCSIGLPLPFGKVMKGNLLYYARTDKVAT